ncbi:MAG TPA: tetratricopeptide repeat protein [Bdellovibrionales bacterium]|nr:tetratricopeptide repeat protein [Bdellovibrionales bacterium]
MDRRSIKHLLFAIAATAMVGCASAPSKDQSFFRDSATDVTNRAPQSLSVPDDTNTIDSVQLRTKADYHYTVAEAYSLEGNSARAIEEYKLTLVYDPNSSQVRVRLAAEYVRQGLINEAVSQAKTAVEIDPKNTDARSLLAGLYSALKMFDAAIQQYRQVMVDNPADAEAPLFVGALYAEQKRYDDAAKIFEKMTKDPETENLHLAWYYLGRVRLESGGKAASAKAEVAFKESLKAKPSYTEALIGLGQLYESTDRKELARTTYEAYQEKSGPNSAVAEELARMYVEKRDYNKAYEQFAVIEAFDKADFNVKAKMAFILIEQEKYREAILRLEEVLAAEPESDRIRFYLGAVYEEVKDYDSAILHFQKVPATSSYFKESIVHMAYLFKLKNDYEKAFETVENGIKGNEDQPQFYALYASLLDDQKEYKRASDMLEKAVAKFPDNAQLLFYLGNMQDRLGQKDEVIGSMKKVLLIDKNHVQALNFLAYSYAEAGIQLEEAEKLAQRALELQPGDAYILDTLGWIQFKRGDVTTAIRTLEAAYKAQPDESVIAEHLADAYYHQQMPERARKLYMRAAELEKNEKNADKIRSKLASIDRQVQDVDRAPASSKNR